MIKNYKEQLYAGVLGKVVGVYFGRPFEGKKYEELSARFGTVDRYLNEYYNVPLIVSDDDITGTFTFIRALSDTGKYNDTTAEDFGNAWLNYIVENESILWWGGAGCSTEHTAYLRLKHGIKAPDSGSIKTNGQNVAEQIGGQIFIDSCGLVLPGEPQRAAELAVKYASVSHDGEAVYAAQVVAAMVSAAFNEKDIHKLLDIGVKYIPQDSMIAEIHENVRTWAKENRKWEDTFALIMKEYGTDKYWGGAHIVPNHALMVMAWAYSDNNFFKALEIVNTAGLDTDCNSGNVGTVMGLIVGVDGINADYDFLSPFADRILMPTAEGTRGITDSLKETEYLYETGCKMMGFEHEKPCAHFNFALKNSRHGFMPEDNFSKCYNNDGKGLTMEFDVNNVERPTKITTPILQAERDTLSGGYTMMSTPIIYPGTTITANLEGIKLNNTTNVTTFVRFHDGTEQHSSSIPLTEGKSATSTLKIEDIGLPIACFGVKINGIANGTILLKNVDFDHKMDFEFSREPILKKNNPVGFINNMKSVGNWNFISENHPALMTELIANDYDGVYVTGTSYWKDYTFSADFGIHMADSAGIIVRYLGIKRYISFGYDNGKLALKEHYDDKVTVLDAKDFTWNTDVFYELKIEAKGNEIKCYFDGKLLFTGKSEKLLSGGAGFCVNMGKVGFTRASINSL